VADEGQSLVIPAICREPPFVQRPGNGREFLLHELASVLISGTRAEVLRAVLYAGGQKIIGPELMSLLAPTAGVDEDRWALIVASLLSLSRYILASEAKMKCSRELQIRWAMASC
jgi:hypothetical protein